MVFDIQFVNELSEPIAEITFLKKDCFQDGSLEVICKTAGFIIPHNGFQAHRQVRFHGLELHLPFSAEADRPLAGDLVLAVSGI